MNWTVGEVSVVLGIVTTVLSFVWYRAHKEGNDERDKRASAEAIRDLKESQQKGFDQLTARQNEFASELQKNTTLTKALEVTLIGIDGKNGMRSSLANVQSELAKVQHDVRNVRMVVNNKDAQ